MTFLAEQRRYERYDAIYVSPHLDDAVYSCAGRVIKERRAQKRVLVVTLFGDGSDAKDSRGKGRISDFETRRREDRAAMAHLDVDFVWFNYPDLVFRRPSVSDLWHIAFPFLPLRPSAMQADMARTLLSLIEARLAPGGTVFFPLSVGFHPDHRIAFDVGRALHALGRFPVEFYEDIPYTISALMMSLRFRYLGLPAQQTPIFRSAKDLNFALFRFFGVLWLTFLPSLFYTFVLLISQRLTGIEDRLEGEPSPVLQSTCRVDDVIDDKIAAMRLYPTQTELFLSMDERIYDMLRGPTGFVERSWRFPPFSLPSRRLTELGLDAEGSRPRERAEPA